MDRNFARSLSLVLKSEGGYSGNSTAKHIRPTITHAAHTSKTHAQGRGSPLP
jgi:hypothetical protein